MVTPLKRREFIKISGAGLGALAFGGSLYSAFETGMSPLTGVQKTPTYCEVCFWK